MESIDSNADVAVSGETTPDFRAMTIAERLAYASELSDRERKRKIAEIEAAHPDWSHAQVMNCYIIYVIESDDDYKIKQRRWEREGVPIEADQMT
jgi:hypothetical protein